MSRYDRARVPFTRQELNKLNNLCSQVERDNSSLSDEIDALRRFISLIQEEMAEDSTITIAQVAARVSLNI